MHDHTFPPSSAEAAAAELVRLYVQKGHNHHACHRFLKKRRMRRPVCVHPWTKGFPPPLLPRFSTTFFNHLLQAGGSRVCSWREPTKLQVQTRISKEDALSTYLQPELLITLFNWLCLIPWFFMLAPPNLLVPSSCAAARPLLSRVCRCA